MQEILPYQHKVQYYETDQMAVVHHSNYIRWFEEARCDILEQMGIPYYDLECRGIGCPVLEVQCVYHTKVRYGETIQIIASLKAYTGLRMTVSYQVVDRAGKIRCTGETKHCFLNKEGRPIGLQKAAPDYDEILGRHLALQHQQDLTEGQKYEDT